MNLYLLIAKIIIKPTGATCINLLPIHFRRPRIYKTANFQNLRNFQNAKFHRAALWTSKLQKALPEVQLSTKHFKAWSIAKFATDTMGNIYGNSILELFKDTKSVQAYGRIFT